MKVGELSWTFKEHDGIEVVAPKWTMRTWRDGPGHKMVECHMEGAWHRSQEDLDDPGFIHVWWPWVENVRARLGHAGHDPWSLSHIQAAITLCLLVPDMARSHMSELSEARTTSSRPVIHPAGPPQSTSEVECMALGVIANAWGRVLSNTRSSIRDFRRAERVLLRHEDNLAGNCTFVGRGGVWPEPITLLGKDEEDMDWDVPLGAFDAPVAAAEEYIKTYANGMLSNRLPSADVCIRGRE